MGDDEDIQEELVEDAGLPVSGGRSKLISTLLYVAAALLGIISVFVISYLVAKNVKGAEYDETLNKTVVKAPPPLDIFPFPEEFRVNTADTDSTHFVKLKIAYGYDKGQLGVQTELTQRIPQMQDLINIILQGKKKTELSGILNQLDLREEIKAHINNILREGKIKEVYFIEFIVS